LTRIRTLLLGKELVRLLLYWQVSTCSTALQVQAEPL